MTEGPIIMRRKRVFTALTSRPDLLSSYFLQLKLTFKLTVTRSKNGSSSKFQHLHFMDNKSFARDENNLVAVTMRTRLTLNLSRRGEMGGGGSLSGGGGSLSEADKEEHSKTIVNYFFFYFCFLLLSVLS